MDILNMNNRRVELLPLISNLLVNSVADLSVEEGVDVITAVLIDLAASQIASYNKLDYHTYKEWVLDSIDEKEVRLRAELDKRNL